MNGGGCKSTARAIAKRIGGAKLTRIEIWQIAAKMSDSNLRELIRQIGVSRVRQQAGHVENILRDERIAKAAEVERGTAL